MQMADGKGQHKAKTELRDARQAYEVKTFAYVELVTFLLKSKIFTITHSCAVIEAEEGFFTLTFVGREFQRMTPLGRTPTGLRCCVSCEGELALHIKTDFLRFV
jgi:hypothetical protein